MKNDYFKIAIRNLRHRSLRSWLTILGFVIGVFMIISLLSLSEGLKQVIMGQMKMMGSEIVIVYPGDADDIMNTMIGGMELTEEDIKIIERTPGVEAVLPFNYQGETARVEGKTKTVILYGVPFDERVNYLSNRMGWKPEQGVFPVPGKRETIVGPVVVKDIFPGLKVGDDIYIAGKKFSLVGILRSQGNKQDDSMIALDLELFKEITGKRRGAPMVMTVIREDVDQEAVAKNIKERLEESGRRQRGKDAPSFSVLTSEKAMQMAGTVIGTIQAAIFAIAGFAILIGAIGIMNTMYTSVRERTKEIGIMKAVGAKTTAITQIFLIESGIMGLIGGTGGMLLGIGLAKLAVFALSAQSSFRLEAYVSPGMIIFTILFAIAIGCVSGYLPARKAAKLNPVDALRYE